MMCGVRCLWCVVVCGVWWCVWCLVVFGVVVCGGVSCVKCGVSWCVVV